MTASFRLKLLASHAAVALVVSGVTLVVVERLVSRRMEQQLDQRLEAQADAVARWMERALHPDQLARRLAGVVDARVTILDAQGIAVGESQAAAGARPGMDSDGQPAEVRAARDGKVGRETRFSPIDAQQVRYVAVPARDNKVVRLGVPIGEMDDTRSELRRQLGAAALASLLAALGLAALVVGPLTRRLRDATEMARRIGTDEPLAAPSSARDEIGVLSRALATAGTELRAIDRRRREFLANVAHEIRTPVTSIRGYAEVLARGPVDPDTGREFLHSIHRNSIRIGSLVEDLLELEAIEAGAEAALARQPVPVAPVVQHVVETLRTRAIERGAAITVDVPADFTMQGDADAIERIVLNLTDNAVLHGGRGVRVTVAARRTADGTSVIVSDTGPGVTAEHRGRIFERFHRGTTASQGSGLGLAIARELARAMGGTLELTGTSTFTLELPG